MRGGRGRDGGCKARPAGGLVGGIAGRLQVIGEISYMVRLIDWYDRFTADDLTFDNTHITYTYLNTYIILPMEIS